MLIDKYHIVYSQHGFIALRVCTLVLYYNIGHFQNEDWFITEETANILLLVCWQWLIKACENMYYGTVFDRKEMQHWELSWL